MQIWLISDWHLGHDNCCVKFKRPDGTPLRAFANAAECDETIIARHNAVVKPSDHVYMLGDVCIRKEHLALVKRFHGHKRLVRGNHDIYSTKEYVEAGFKEIHGCRVISNVMLTHVPIHPRCLARFAGNVHGHVHAQDQFEGAYLNVSVDAGWNNYTPITLEAAVHRLDTLRNYYATMQPGVTALTATSVDHESVSEIELLHG